MPREKQSPSAAPPAPGMAITSSRTLAGSSAQNVQAEEWRLHSVAEGHLAGADLVGGL